MESRGYHALHATCLTRDTGDAASLTPQILPPFDYFLYYYYYYDYDD